MRHVLSMLLVLSLPLASCKDEVVEQPAPPVTSTDEGDWSDTGPFASCTVRPGFCGDRSTFDVFSCDPESLTRFDADGVYTLHVRATYPEYGNALSFQSQAMRVSATGQQSAGGWPLVTREVAQDQVFLSSVMTDTQGRTRRRSYMGCIAPEPGHLRGCYVECSDNAVVASGTFEARKVESGVNEAQASGLTLVSEVAVSRGTAVDVYVTRGHAYVVSLGGGLFVYDVRDPARPVLTEHIRQETDNYWNGVWAKDGALYVASAARGVLVFDIENPAHPVQVGVAPGQAMNVHTVFVSGNLLLAASPDPDGVVLVFDVSQPLRPALLSIFQADGFNPARSYGPHDMFVFEGQLYANYWGSGYVVASLKDPERPRELGRYRYAHSTSHASAVGRFGDRLIAFEGGEDWGAHLRVLDVTQASAPKRIGEYRRAGHVSIHNMVLVGTRLYVGWYHDGVRVLDVSVPEQPREVAHFNTFRPDDPDRGTSFYDGAIGIRVPGDGIVYTVDTSRGLMLLREP